jgi:hypothetical protein
MQIRQSWMVASATSANQSTGIPKANRRSSKSTTFASKSDSTDAKGASPGLCGRLPTNKARHQSEAEAITIQHPGWVLRIVGVLIASIGLVWLLTPSIPWLGKLSADFAIKRENFRFYSPLATYILLSLRIGCTILPVDTEERKAPPFNVKDLMTRRFHSLISLNRS